MSSLRASSSIDGNSEDISVSAGDWRKKDEIAKIELMRRLEETGEKERCV